MVKNMISSIFVFVCGSSRILGCVSDAIIKEKEEGNTVVAEIDEAEELVVVTQQRPRCPKCKMWRHCQYSPNHVALMHSGCCQVPMVLEPYIGRYAQEKIDYVRKKGIVIRYVEYPNP